MQVHSERSGGCESCQQCAGPRRCWKKMVDLDLFFFSGSASSPVCIDTHVSYMCLKGVK